MIKAVINVAAPRPQVFSVLSDYANYKQWVPGCEQCRVVSADANTADIDITINSMKRIEIGVRFEAQPSQALNFRMTRGKELKAYSGTYRLMDSTDGAGTVVLAELDIDVGMMVPKFMVDKMTRKMMDETGAALRKYLQSAPGAAAPSRAARPAAGGRRRTRSILRVTRTPSGYNVCLMGETFSVKSPAP
jgi:carbon monoxide dehydrogenase subunit G